MSRFLKWAQRQRSGTQQALTLIFGVLLFLIGIPALLVLGSSSLDTWLGLPRLLYGLANPLVAAPLILVGWLMASWSVLTLLRRGKGTPVPLVPTLSLVVEGPYAHCRNPMVFGTLLFYLGIAVWIGSLSAIALVALFAASVVVYIKRVEERELEDRFGADYGAYRSRTPFLIPRVRRRG